MANEITLSVLFGFISSVLLGIVAYFIKQLHADFRKMGENLSDVKTTGMLIRSESKTSHELLNQKVEYLEQRINKIELKQIKNHDHEK
ncbi:hypothetical protein [Kaistella rhinocerotis]|uniref:hypothetical protein n=1 Tax=Kaistella rhinocerotis TaxID=3026437 RepID=UPI00255216C3|nr:hypothetical protein [Kaistella sp. Ran72]